VDNGNGTINVSGGHVVIRDANDVHTGVLMEWDTPALTGISLTNNTTNYVWAHHNGTDTELTVTTTMPAGAGMDYSILYFITRVGTNIHVVDMRNWGLNYPLANSYKDFNVYGYEWKPGGTIISSPAGRYVAVTAGSFYLATVEHTHSAFDTSGSETFTTVYLSAGGSDWVRTTGQTVISNTQYDSFLTMYIWY
jgi:hypothetical protein